MSPNAPLLLREPLGSGSYLPARVRPSLIAQRIDVTPAPCHKGESVLLSITERTSSSKVFIPSV